MKVIANLGDVDYLKYGGAMLVQSPDNYYYLEGYTPESEGGDGLIYQVEPEPLDLYHGHLIPRHISEAENLPYPIEAYYTWFDSRDLLAAANYAGLPVDELQVRLTSDDVITRARAYLTLIEYVGWFEFDQYPIELSPAEIAARYNLPYTEDESED